MFILANTCPHVSGKKIIQRNNIQVGFEFQNITKHACGATANVTYRVL